MKKKLLNKMIDRGVEKVKNYGYPNVDKTNILTDYIYSDMFRSILISSYGKGYDNEINELLTMIKTDDELMF